MARKYLVSLDLSKNELQNAVVQVLAAAPSSPAEGQIYYNSVDHKAYIFNGTAWKALDEATVISFGVVGDIAASAVGDTAAAGTTGKVADAGHRHARESFGSTASVQAVGDSQNAGAATTPSRSDHKHGLPSFGAVTSQTSFGASANSGAGTSIARNDHVHGTPTHTGTEHSTISLSSLAAPTADLSAGGFRITNLALTPVADSDAVSKSYADALVNGLSWKDSVRVVSGSNVTITAPGSTIDGLTMASGDRVLLAGQSSPGQNGIWVWNGAAVSMTRPADADSTSELKGAAVFVESGTYADQQWILTTDTVTTINTTAQTWTQFGGTQSYTAGNGIDIAGGTISAKLAASGGLAFSGSSLAVDTAIVARKYSVSIGNGSLTSFTVSHGLGTADVTVQVYDNSTGAQVEADVTHALTSPFAVTVGFTSAPSTNAFRVVVVG